MESPPKKCGARHLQYTNVGPCEITGDHDARLFPHRGIATGEKLVGVTVDKQPIFQTVRWWRKWYEEPRAEWPRNLGALFI